MNQNTLGFLKLPSGHGHALFVHIQESEVATKINFSSSRELSFPQVHLSLDDDGLTHTNALNLCQVKWLDVTHLDYCGAVMIQAARLACGSGRATIVTSL